MAFKSKINPKLNFVQKLFLAGIFTSPLLSLRFQGFTISDYLLTSAFILTITFYNKGPIQKTSGAEYIYIIGLLVTIVAIFNSMLNPDPIGSLLVLGRFIFLILLLPWTLLKLFSYSEQKEIPLSILKYGILFFATTVLYDSFENKDTFSSLDRNVGLAQHPTDAGGFLTLGVVLWYSTMNKNNKFFNILALTITHVGLLLTGSISALISTFVGILVYTLLNRKTKNNRIVKTKNFIFFVIFVGLILSNNIFEISDRFKNATSGRYDTVDSRLQNYSETLSAIFADLNKLLFGHGLSTSQSIVESSVTYSYAPHNYILQMLLQGGLVFTILMVVYQLLAARKAIKVKSSYAISIIAIMVSQTCFALTSPVMFTRYLWLPFVLSVLIFKKNQRNFP